MINSYKSLKNLISEKLNDNTNEILFNVSLYNSKKTKYETNFNENDGVTVTTKRIVPTNISEIVGEYINVPNISVTDNAISLEFDLFVGDYSEVPYLEQEKYRSVDYLNTLDSIDNFRKELLAKVYPLGDVGLMFGGTDSTARFNYASVFIWNTIYFEFDIRTNDVETILYGTNGTNFTRIRKDDTNIILELGYIFDVDTHIVETTVETPYLLGLNDIYVFYDVDDYWNLKVGDTNNKTLDATTQTSFAGGTISSSTDLNGVLYQLLIDDSVITLEDANSGLESKLGASKINLKNFTSRYTLNQEGELVLTVATVTNSILWGEDGNAVFSFETLVPFSDIRWFDEGKPYQMFGLGINALISNDIVFGNNFEYFLDGTQIYPIDRQHTYGTELGTAQYLTGNYAKSIAEENAKDITQTFYYTPDKHITNLLKQTTGNSEEQNKVYELIVQYPFHKETYNVIVDSGGTSTNTNTFSTITVTYKQKDDSLA